jgi:purine-nucleoside phosphorylase
VLVADHLTLTAASPLAGPRFVDLTDAWSPRLRAIARGLDPTLAEGVYAWLPGPHYETWAEAEWLRRVGADMLGMSTVPEAVAARELGLEVLGLSTVTAVEGPDGAASGIDPEEVVAVAERTAVTCGPLLAELVARAVPTPG